MAQTTGAVNSTLAPAEKAPNEEPPPGGCMPIGLTASGEIVFPFQCKDVIERHKGENPKPTASDDKPTTAERPTAAQEKPTIVEEKPITTEQRPAAAEEKPTLTEGKPAAEEKPALTEEEKKDSSREEKDAVTKQPENVAAKPDQPQVDLLVRTPSSRHAELETRKNAAAAPGCTHFRTYDAASRTYRAYDGQLRQCR